MHARKTENVLDQWVFTLFCIETKSYYTVNGAIAYTRFWNELNHNRLLLETMTGSHYDVHSKHESEVKCHAKSSHG